MEQSKDNNLKVMNTAKLFSEEILFPLMEQYQSYQRQSDFGSYTLEDSLGVSEEVRDILRYNGLKAMCDVCLNLAMAIKSTVYLKKNQEEIEQINKTIEYLGKIKEIFYNKRDAFFISTYNGQTLIEKVNRNYFEKVKEMIQVCYVNIEMLMTRNKLLFADGSDEFKTDEEIKEDILKRYVEG